MVPKAGRELGDDPRALLHLTQQQTAGVRGDRPAIKLTPHFASKQGVKLQGFLVTLCRQKAVLLLGRKFFSPQHLCHEVTAFFNFFVRYPG